MSDLDWQSIAERFKDLYVAAVCDVLDRRGYRFQYLHHSIHPIKDEHQLAGPAFTVVGTQNSTMDIEERRGPTIVDSFPAHSVAVYETNGTETTGVWGELWTAGAIKRGCVGAVVDGAIRDSKKIKELDFPIFYKYRVPADSVGRFNAIDWQVPVNIGGVRVEPGDYVFGDQDGIVIIPKALTMDVLAEAEALKLTEDEIRKRINNDESLAQLYKQYGRL